MIVKWTSIRSVLDVLSDAIPADMYSEGIMLEQCARAMDMIGFVSQYEAKIDFKEVKNHKTTFPKGLVQFNQIAYKQTTAVTDDDLEEIERYLGIDDEDNMSDSLLPFNVLEPLYRTNNWQPLRLATSSFALSVHCDDCADINCPNCNHEYSVSPNGIISTSFEQGYICISYWAYPTDSNGDFMIPDHEYFKEALKNFCLSKYWEKRYNSKEDGAERRYLQYKADWGLYKGKAMAEMSLPDVAEMENVKNLWVRLIPKHRRFQSFFGNLNTEEWFKSSGFAYNYR